MARLNLNRLNGWQRLWLVGAVVWTVAAGPWAVTTAYQKAWVAHPSLTQDEYHALMNTACGATGADKGMSRPLLNFVSES